MEPELSTTTFDGMARPQGGLLTHQKQTLGRWSGSQWGTAVPKVLTRQEEACQVREFALQYQRTDSGFAVDLLGAADRHEVGA